MIFNSIPFLVFIVVFLAVKPMVWKKDSTRWSWILIMSCLFYGWWDWRFLMLLIGTGSVDYYCGKMISASKGKKFFLYLSVVSNLGALALFKYSFFIARSIDQLIGVLGFNGSLADSIPEFTLILPVGISFYTFNSLSYTIDLYRGKTRSADSWLHFMAFISFFPHLVAGPIIRARDILGQLKKVNKVDYLEMYDGVKTCVFGFFQKLVLADNLAVYVNNSFDGLGKGDGTLSWWLCMLAFTFQIYFDFNGYSTIARGIAKLCGIHFKLNFNHPYKANGFSDFWKRWHISLSSFFRDYVYISMGGSRKGKLKAEFNRWVTMLLSGLWHGANWTFVAWGAVHAFLLSMENLLKSYAGKFIGSKLYRVFVFVVIVLTWVLFRAESISDAFVVYHNMFSWHPGPLKEIVLSNAFVILLLGALFEFTISRKVIYNMARKPLMDALMLALIAALTIFFRGPEQQFIYFQF